MNLHLKSENPAALVFWMILGQRADGTVCWVDQQGAMHPVEIGDDCAAYQSPLGAGATIPIVPMSSARVTFTVGQPLAIAIVKDGNGRPNVQDAVFWNPSDKNYNVVWDKVEFTLTTAQLWANTTTVDFFSIPLTVSITDGKTTLATAPLAVPRSEVFDRFRASPPFDSLAVGDVRVLAPGYGQTFPADYMDSYILDCWSYMAENPVILSLDGAPAGYTRAVGQVVGGVLYVVDNFGGEYQIGTPSSADVLLCSGVFNIDGSLPPCLSGWRPRIPRGLTATSAPDHAVGNPHDVV